MLNIVHSIPGRARLQATFLRSNSIMIERVRQGIAQIEGVVAVTPNPATGSLVIGYDTRRLSDVQLWHRLEEGGYLSAPRTPQAGPASPATSLGQLVMETASQALIEALLKRSTGALIGALT